MNEEHNKLADQAVNLVRPLISSADAVTSDTALYFRGAERLRNDSRKSMILENIKFIRDNIDELEKLL